MFDVPIILAHGALGAWDELIFLGIAVIFTGMVIYTWFKSRSLEPELIDTESSQPDASDEQSHDHIALR